MNVNVEKENEHIVKLHITIPAQEAVDAYNAAVRTISQHVRIDGFRQGKAPRAIVEREVGVERIKHEALEHLLPSAISKAIQENNLDIVTQPTITEYKFNIGEDLTLVASAELRPEVKLGQYKGLKLEVKGMEMGEDALEKSLDKFLEQHSTQQTVTDRATNNTDIAVIDFEGVCNGEKIKGGDAKNYPLDLGNSNFIPGFAEQIVGKNLNDEFDIDVTFPEDYHDDKLKGQKATFKIKINEIKEKVKPELTDEFAQKFGDFKTVDDLKADMKKYLDNQKETNDKQQSENEVFKTVVDSAEVNISDTMIQREVNSLKAEYKNRLAAQGINWDNIVKTQGEDKLTENLTADAKTRIKNSLVIDKIAKEEKIAIGYDDLEKEMRKLGALYGMQAKDVLQQFGKNPEFLTSISQQAMNSKVRDFLMENNTVEIK